MNQGVLKLAVNGQLDLERIARDLLDSYPSIFISLAEKQVKDLAPNLQGYATQIRKELK